MTGEECDLKDRGGEEEKSDVFCKTLAPASFTGVACTTDGGVCLSLSASDGAADKGFAAAKRELDSSESSASSPDVAVATGRGNSGSWNEGGD